MLGLDLNVIKLDKANMERYLPDLLEIEHLVYLKRGHRYSTEEWGENQFLIELPGKFDLSFGVIWNSKLVAFMISSSSIPGMSHVHRVAVHPKYPGDNTGTKLMLRAFLEWQNMPEYQTFTGIIRADHKLSVPFAKRIGAQIADKSFMTSLFERIGRTNVHIFDNYFEDEYGIRYVLVYMQKEEK
jgi:ribosomal protein S18 acetylase RimI-like enzyme